MMKTADVEQAICTTIDLQEIPSVGPSMNNSPLSTIPNEAVNVDFGGGSDCKVRTGQDGRCRHKLTFPASHRNGLRWSQAVAKATRLGGLILRQYSTLPVRIRE
jgi:hypothetical protein